MQRFEDYMGSLRLGRRFLTLEDERALMRLGLEGYGLPLQDSRSALMNAAKHNDLVLESQIAEEMSFLLNARAGRGRQIRRADFQGVVDAYQARIGNRIPRPETESRVKRLAQQEGITPRRSGWLWPTRGWFESIGPPPGSVLSPGEQIVGGQITGFPGQAMVPLTLGDPVVGAMSGPPVGGAAGVGTVLAAWSAALSARDVPAILRLYTPDALLMATAEGSPLRGPQQIEGYFTRLAANPGLTVTFNQEIQRLNGQPRVVSGLYTFFWNDLRTGQPVTTPARYTFGILPDTGTGVAGRITLHHSSRVPGPNPDSELV